MFRSPPNLLTTRQMAAHGCHFTECFLYMLVVNIEIIPSLR
jgi:hypothetical protein